MRWPSTNKALLSVAGAFAGQLAGAGFAFLFNIVMAVLVGAAGMGVYFIVLTLVDIGNTVARLGLETAVLRLASIARADKQDRELSGLYRQSLKLVLGVGTVLALGIAVMGAMLPLGGEAQGDYHDTVGFMGFAVVPAALLFLHAEFFKAVGEPIKGTVLYSVLPIMSLTLIVFLMSRSTSEWKVADVAAAYLGVFVAGLLLAMFVWAKRYPFVWALSGRYDSRLLLRISLPMLVVTSMNLIMGWTDILTLGFLADAEEAGIYGVAVRIATLTTFVLSAVNSVVAPQFAALWEAGDHAGLQRYVQLSTVGMIVAVSPVALAFLLYPDFVLALFGDEFTSGDTVLRVLIVGQVINVITGSVGYLLLMTRHERLLRNNIIVCALLNLLGNLALVPEYGALGAAVSTAASVAVMNVVSFVLVCRNLRINTLGFFGGNLCGHR